MEAVIFVGIQASGKSTFYTSRFADTHTRINLDTLRTRKREETLLTQCIRERRPFVVDNTNVLARERARYIASAKSAGYKVIGYFFDTSLADALKRNSQRAAKAAIPRMGIIAKFRAMQIPQLSEGFDLLYRVSISSDGDFVVHVWLDQTS